MPDKITLPIGQAVLAQISPNAAIREDIMSMIKGQNLLGKSIYRTWSTKSFASGVGKKCDYNVITNLGAIFQSLDAAEDDQNVVIDKAIQHYEISCADPFHFVPILILCENGETITEQKSDDTDPANDVDAGLTGMFSAKYGPISIGRLIRDNGDDWWIGRVTHDITAECRKYTKQMTRDQINENSIKELFSSAHTTTRQSEQTVAINELLIIHSHLEKAKIVRI